MCSWNYKYSADRAFSLESEHFYLSIKGAKWQQKSTYRGGLIWKMRPEILTPIGHFHSNLNTS